MAELRFSGRPKRGLPRASVAHALLDLLHVGFASSASWQPAIDVLVSSEFAQIHCELAGVVPSAIELSVAGHLLRIAGRRPSPLLTCSAGFDYRRAEIQYGDFERIVELPWLIDPGRLQIDCRNGLLSIEAHPLGAERGLERLELTVELDEGSTR